jgi:hypothetical protein
LPIAVFILVTASLQDATTCVDPPTRAIAEFLCRASAAKADSHGGQMAIKRCKSGKRQQLRLRECFVLGVTARTAADLPELQAKWKRAIAKAGFSAGIPPAPPIPITSPETLACDSYCRIAPA